VENIWNEYFAGSEAVFGYFERLAVSKKEGRAVRPLPFQTYNSILATQA
jgi:hypothetical protein